MAESDAKLWPDGYFYNEATPGFISKLEGNTLIEYPLTVAIMGLPGMTQGSLRSVLTSGEFGEANEEMTEASGLKDYNTKMETYGSIKHCIWNAEKQTLYQQSSVVNQGKVQALKWITEEDAKKLIDDCDPFEDLPCPYYETNPELQGKFIWVTGPPGAGKSTTCHMFSKTRKDFIYYEADSWLFLVNPFIDPAAPSPTDGIRKNKAMKDVPTEVGNAMECVSPVFTEFMVGNFNNADKLEPLYRCIAKDIKKRKAKMGLNWAVAQGCPTRYLRDAIKEENPEVIFIILLVSPELQVKRIKERTGGKDAPQAVIDMLGKIFEVFKPADDDEEKAFNLEITENMTPEDVGNKILELIQAT